MPIVPSSALTKFIKSLGDTETIKAATLPNRLAKHVKPEELEWSGVADRLRELDPKQSVTKQDLLDWDANRNDVWSESPRTAKRGDANFSGTTLSSSDSSTYFEDVRQFNERAEDPDILGDIMDSFDPDLSQQSLTGRGGPQPRQVQSHFSRTSPNYIAHARGTIEPIAGKKTRLIQEVQSDLHQNAIGAGGYQGDMVKEYTVGAMGRQGGVDEGARIIRNNEGSFYLESDDALRGFEDGGEVSYPSRTFNSKQQAEDYANKLQEEHPDVDFAIDTKERPLVGGPPKSPLKKNWARKEIERQILKAVDEGQEAIAIPLEGARSEMARSSGVQRWYETQVRSTLKKIAKQIPGAEYKEVGDDSKLIDIFARDEGYQEVEDALETMHRVDNNRLNEVIQQLESMVSADGSSPFDMAVTNGNYTDALTLLPEEEVHKVLPFLVNEGRSLDEDKIARALYAMPETLAKLNAQVSATVSNANDLMFSPKIHAQTLARGRYEDELSRVLSNKEWAHLYDVAGGPRGVTYGQIILPPSEMVQEVKYATPPKSSGELGKFLADVFNDNIGDVSDWFGNIKLEMGEQAATPEFQKTMDDMLEQYVDDKATTFSRLDTDKLVNKLNEIDPDTEYTTAMDRRQLEAAAEEWNLNDVIRTQTLDILKEDLDDYQKVIMFKNSGYDVSDEIAAASRASALQPTDEDILKYVQKYWDNILSSTGGENIVVNKWPEITPEIRQVFKRWEEPPKDAAELTKLYSDLDKKGRSADYTIAIGDAVRRQKINNTIDDPEELKLAINKYTGRYNSIFTSPDLFGVVDELSPIEIKELPLDIHDDVLKVKNIIDKDDPKAELEFIQKYWGDIQSEKNLPVVKEKITPATYRYPEWTKKFELYSAGALGLAATATPDDARAQDKIQREEDPVGALLREGVDLEELSLAIQDKNGMTPEEARDAIHTSMQANIDKLIGQEEPELIEAAMQEKYGDFISDANFNYGGDFPEEPMAGESNYELVPVADIKEYANKSEQELYAANENFNFVHSELINLFKGVALEDEDAMIKFNKYNKDLNYHIANNLRSMGRNVEVSEDNQIVVVNEDGSKEPLSDGFWSDMGMALAASEKEIGFGIGGAVAAGMAAKRVLPYLGLPGKLASAGVLLAEMAGGVTGTVVGRGLDMAYNSYTEKEDVELDFYTKQLMEAGMFDFVAGATIGASLKVAKETILGVGRALKYIASGTPNREGAYKALKHYTNLSDEDIEELVTKYEQTTGTTLPGSKEEKGMAAVPQMQPDAESLVDTASKYSPTLTTDIARTIDARAKDVITLAQETSPDNIGIVVKDALQNYEKDVKGFYTTVKTKAIKKVDPAYQFDFDRTAVKPFLKDIESRITNPSIQRRVQLYLDRVEQIGELRSFKDLLDLRSTMNDFKYNTRIRSAVDFDSINKVINKIDSEIEIAVDTMPDGQAWLKEWKMANTEYSKMLKTRKNALYKVLNRPGVSEKVMVTAMSKYINSLDGTFMQVVSKLPVRKRKMVEGAVLEHLVSKHTIGDPQGMQAINFPGLSEELKSIGFTSTKARNLKRGVNMLSDVFKNDHNLARLSNTIHTEKAAQGLTTDLVAKAHYSLMAKIWSKMQSIIPFNNNAEFVALGLNIEKVLRNPQNAKAVEDLIKMFPKDEEIESGVRQLALVAADFGKRENYPYVKLHKIGNDRKVRNGKYGKGVYYSTDEGSVKGRAAPNKLKTSSREVLPELIATPADVKAILGTDEITPEMVKASPDLKEKLMNRGYEGFAIGHDVVIFPE